ncbi:hypothetical protein B1A87_007250 [Arthrobacter sp. KBS0703]|uniref:hypothetical protein n=1 Tax=Arthrobacter sp. KBS0703 TaxID=1955698 RepID=UPI00098FE473|nr:hypothetical protein [Arthrobacter sp. KBS0703]TSE15723.1 hypothetical protein B1A87_007250 [Arthrobacter sp. KBS0703]
MAVQARKRVLRHGLVGPAASLAAACVGWAATFAVLPGELGRTYGELGEASQSSGFAAVAAGFSILALAVIGGQIWRLFTMGQVGTRLVWEVPAGAGLAPSWPFEGEESGLVGTEEVRSGGCICLAEFRRSFPGADDHVIEEEGIHASDYCPLHGIDRVNGLSPKDFAALVGESWLWDEQSDLPGRAGSDEKRLLLYGFAGHGFTGIPLRPRAGLVDAAFPEIGLAREGISEVAEPGWDKSDRPAAGLLDTIDLRPAGYNGFAFRYRHGRAWFEAAK